MAIRAFDILKTLGIQPVLLDIGASGGFPSFWAPIAQYSTYIGFDPDNRELRDIQDGQFSRSVIFNKAVISCPGGQETEFFLTKSPYCSSSLPPDPESLSDYLFSDLFEVNKAVSVPATTINAALDSLGVKHVDWFKTDSQGIDLRLFLSLNESVRSRVLAVDIEPGLIDAYKGEDLFVDVHCELLKQGLWLSSLQIRGSVRMQRKTLRALNEYNLGLNDLHINRSVRSSPCWCEARYLRSIQSLKEQNANQREYALLWLFAIMGGQWGYGLDIASEFEQQFGRSEVCAILRSVPVMNIRKRNSTFRNVCRRILPRSVKEAIMKLALE